MNTLQQTIAHRIKQVMKRRGWFVWKRVNNGWRQRNVTLLWAVPILAQEIFYDVDIALKYRDKEIRKLKAEIRALRKGEPFAGEKR